MIFEPNDRHIQLHASLLNCFIVSFAFVRKSNSKFIYKIGWNLKFCMLFRLSQCRSIDDFPSRWEQTDHIAAWHKYSASAHTATESQSTIRAGLTQFIWRPEFLRTYLFESTSWCSTQWHLSVTDQWTSVPMWPHTLSNTIIHRMPLCPTEKVTTYTSKYMLMNLIKCNILLCVFAEIAAYRTSYSALCFARKIVHSVGRRRTSRCTTLSIGQNWCKTNRLIWWSFAQIDSSHS